LKRWQKEEVAVAGGRRSGSGSSRRQEKEEVAVAVAGERRSGSLERSRFGSVKETLTL
jgi:hypothetical protein